MGEVDVSVATRWLKNPTSFKILFMRIEMKSLKDFGLKLKEEPKKEPEEIIEYDENNKLIHHKDSNGFECWREYDENNNLIHSKDSNGLEFWQEYDDNNNEIYFKNSYGYERWIIQEGELELINGKYSLNGEEVFADSPDVLGRKIKS